MLPTSLSLLDRLKRQPLHEDWSRFVALYQPFIARCIRLDPALSADADDVCQEVMTKLIEHLPRFERRRDGSFRTWLKTITANEVAQFWRRRARSRNLGGDEELLLAGMHDPKSELSQWWEREHRVHVLKRLQELIEPEFSPVAWRAFRLRVFDQNSTEEAARILGISKNSVDIHKSRVLARLREEAAGLVED
jgi:RNA polymerase sigma-70 factor (ECF subfamily)